MEIFNIKSALSARLENLKSQGKSIGLVPTMGALHNGHISLLEIAKSYSDITVCSIFVNPTQFNDPADLAKYPRPIEDDIQKIECICDVLFLPGVSEMYQPGEQWHLDIGELEHILEGKMRPGHYQGVTQIVKKLFDSIKPDKAYFGQKDYQQFKVIEKMIQLFDIPVQLVMCPIIREPDGLAMSSRNSYLSDNERKHALALFKALKQTLDNFDKKPVSELRREALAMLNGAEGIQPEYFEIRDTFDLGNPGADTSGGLIALTAARVGNTRLIDNMILR